MAMPKLPVVSGSAASMALPDSVVSDGLGMHVAPQVAIMLRR